MFGTLLTIGLLVLVVVLVVSLFVPKLQDKVKWTLRKALAVVIISVVTLALVVLAHQVALLSFAVIVIFGLLGIVFWLLHKLLQFAAKQSEKAYLWGLNFAYEGFGIIGKTIKTIAKKVWSRW